MNTHECHRFAQWNCCRKRLVILSLGDRQSCKIIREVAEVTRTWQAVAAEVGARRAEIARMASAFEHEDLQAALKL